MAENSRLTGWDKGSPYIRECFERTAEQGGCENMGTQQCIRCKHDLAVTRRLAQYEDSGLGPEQINMLLKKVAEAIAGCKHCFTQEHMDIILGGDLKSMLDKLSEYESTGLSPGDLVNELIESGVQK